MGGWAEREPSTSNHPRLDSETHSPEIRWLREARPGRRRTAADIRKLVIEIANANPNWGYTKIRDAVRGLKIDVGRTTSDSTRLAAGTGHAGSMGLEGDAVFQSELPDELVVGVAGDSNAPRVQAALVVPGA